MIRATARAGFWTIAGAAFICTPVFLPGFIYHMLTGSPA